MGIHGTARVTVSFSTAVKGLDTECLHLMFQFGRHDKPKATNKCKTQFEWLLLVCVRVVNIYFSVEGMNLDHISTFRFDAESNSAKFNSKTLQDIWIFRQDLPPQKKEKKKENDPVSREHFKRNKQLRTNEINYDFICEKYEFVTTQPNFNKTF